MQLSFRWSDADDAITLERIRQIPGTQAIAAAVQDIPVGEVWGIGSILNLRKQIEDVGMTFDVIENIPVHEDIKLGRPGKDQYIENYCENIRRVAASGIKCICYDFMPLPERGTRHTKEEKKKILNEYRSLGERGFWKNLQYFLDRMIPIAIECNVNMAIQPDDFRWKIQGIPYIVSCEEQFDRILKQVDDPHNGLVFATGSFEGISQNALKAMAARYTAMGRIHYVHLGNDSTADMYAILKTLHDNGFDGYIELEQQDVISGDFWESMVKNR